MIPRSLALWTVFFFNFFNMVSFIPGTCATKTLQLEPQRIVVLFGSPASANCSTNATHHGLGWEASQGGVDRMENVQLITWTVDSLTHWDIQPICYVISTADEQKLLPLDITVYSEFLISHFYDCSMSTDNILMFMKNHD